MEARDNVKFMSGGSQCARFNVSSIPEVLCCNM
ncbi:hypothetical protein SAMN05421659_110105 [[Clostridium] fimetarium]|uniref:Uncharacterized protein n=1 Tax=[Clostridium] fimetarium TaxID=99656 RepID=A0A1I0QZH8_9FIRM|nr:hypothetical protein SAMN05421659_110105 [[Clostridium] fimetarium]